jgi:integrase
MRRKHGEGRIFARGKISWVQFYDVHGRQVRESTGIEVRSQADQTRVEKILRKKLAEVSEGTRRDTRRVTYETLRERYYSDYTINDRKSLRRDKDGKPYLDKIQRLDTFFSGFQSSEIDADLIRKFIADQQSKRLGNATINRSISALRRMFNLAVEDGELRDVPHFPMLKEPPPRSGFFEAAEYEALYRALPDYLRLPLAIGYYTGMREGEILSINWNQVDLLAGTIDLMAGTTKNDEARTIPIIPQLRAVLMEQRAKRQAQCPFVCFRLDKKGHAVKIGTFYKTWQSRCIQVGLGKMEPAVDPVTGETIFARPRGPRSKPKAKMIYKGKIFHDLRRTGVRNLVNAGIPERVAQRISGHKTRSVFDRYHIVSKNDLVEAGKKLAAFHGNGDNSGTISAPETLTVM